MGAFTESLQLSWQLVAQADPGLLRIVGLSLQVSGLATLAGAVIGLLGGAWLAVARFPGQRWVVAGLNTLLALPSVVVGLVVYLLLSRTGPLGFLGWLFSPTAMVVAQTVLVVPVVTALTRQLIADAGHGNAEQLRSMGAGTGLTALLLLVHERLTLLTVLLTAFGRAISEVGAVMIVGGNIDGYTRVMTTTIALETSKGDLPLALALGIVLLSVVALINAAITVLQRRQQRHEGAGGGAVATGGAGR